MSKQSSKSIEIAEEALSRARGGLSVANYMTVIEGFASRGISPDDITPRENVLTYHAWRALGRQVRKGEKGVSICVFVPTNGKPAEDDGKDGKNRGGMRPRRSTVFHESQTDPIA